MIFSKKTKGTYRHTVRPQSLFWFQCWLRYSNKNPISLQKGWIKTGVLTGETSQAHLARWLNINICRKSNFQLPWTSQLLNYFALFKFALKRHQRGPSHFKDTAKFFLGWLLTPFFNIYKLHKMSREGFGSDERTFGTTCKDYICKPSFVFPSFPKRIGDLPNKDWHIYPPMLEISPLFL